MSTSFDKYISMNLPMGEIDYIPYGSLVRVNAKYFKRKRVLIHLETETQWVIGRARRSSWRGEIGVQQAEYQVGAYDTTKSTWGTYDSIEKSKVVPFSEIRITGFQHIMQTISVPQIDCSVVSWIEYPSLVKIPQKRQRTPLVCPTMPTLKKLRPQPTEVIDEPMNKIRKMGAYRSPPIRDPEEGETPNLIGSLGKGEVVHATDSSHYPCIDLDYKAKLVPSQTKGHYHLYLGKTVRWDKYLNVLFAMADAGLIEYNYAKASVVRGMTAVRPPLSHISQIVKQRVDAGESFADVMSDIDIVISGANDDLG